MSWASSSTKNNVRPAARGEQSWDAANFAASVQSVYQRVEKHATSDIDRYSDSRKNKRRRARTKQKPVTVLAGKTADVSFTL